MNDPCRECEHIEQRNHFLSKHYIPLSDLDSLKDGDLVEQALKKYQESEQKYKHLIDNAPDAIFIADAETGVILEANRKAAELLGIPVEQIVGMHQTQLHPKDESDNYRDIFHQHVKNKTFSVTNNIYVCHSDGHRIPVQVNATVTCLGGRDIIFGLFRDVSEQKQLQQELSHREQRYRDLYNQAQAALFVTDLDGVLLDCNLAAVELFGYSPDEKKEKYLNKVRVTDYYINPDQRKRFIEELQQNKQVKDFQSRLRRDDGNTFWGSIAARLTPDGFIEGAIYDITIAKTLTKKEITILEHILQGKSNKEIANILSRSIRTVEDHRSHIMHKLGADNLVELVQKAQSLHFNQPE